MRNIWLLALIASWIVLAPHAWAADLDYSTRENTLAWFRDARFGIFIHWDPRANAELGSFDPDIRPDVKRAQEEAMFSRLPDDRFKWQTWNSAYWTASRDDANPWLIVDMRHEMRFQQIWLVEMHSHPAVRG